MNNTRAELTAKAVDIQQELDADTSMVSPRLIADDATIEALGTLLADHGGIMAQFSSEGGIFQILAGLYRDVQLAVEVHLKAYSGDPLRVDRKSRKSEIVPRPLLTVGLTVQPYVIRRLADNPGLRDRGVVPRFLYSFPGSRVGYRRLRPPPVTEDARTLYATLVTAIASLNKEADDGQHTLILSPEAEALFDAYRAETEPKPESTEGHRWTA